MQSTPPCKLCGSTTSALNLDAVNLYCCSNCGLISDNIIYDDAFLAELYAKMYGGDTYYNAHLDEHNKLLKNEKVSLGWHKKVALDIINDAVKKEGNLNVLEFGAGVGIVGSHYKGNESINYSGIELDSNAAELARSRGCNVRQGSITSNDLDNAAYDFVFSFEVMEHIADLKQAIVNIRSILKPDGAFIFSTPNFHRKNNYNDNKLHQEAPPVHINFFTKDNLPSIFKDFGMKVVAVYERPYPFLSSPKSHWVRTFLGKYHGATLVAVVTAE